MIARSDLTSLLATPAVESGILRAAVEVFAERGFGATRVEDVLERAAVARRTFYKYFGSKEDVLARVYGLATAELLGAIQAASLAATHDPMEAIRYGLDAYLDYHVANGKLLRVLVQQAIRSDSPLFALRRKFREDLFRFLDAAVRTRGGEPNDPMLYTALISAVEGVSLELLASKPSARDVARAKTALHFILDRTLAV
jgi:AcrR family transcriptional regulator